MVGIQDYQDDFFKLQNMWCKYMFPYKPASQGAYPYYPSCHVKDFAVPNQNFCFDAQNAARTVNTFMTALRDDEFSFFIFRPGIGYGTDGTQQYKCCKTPPGYYIDYVSCYYKPTRDQYWEYYDSQNHFVVFCTAGFVMTGIARKLSPINRDYHIEWIQCCRVGYGPPRVQVTPQAGMPSTSYDNSSIPYSAQYRSLDDEDKDLDQAYLPSHQPHATYRMPPALDQVPTISSDAEAVEWQSLRYKKGPVPKLLRLKPPTPMALHTTMLGSGLVSI
ncbi:hypothetical protein RvY_07904-2 [Ramazzottius varieornatus]|nr:hypothetical protein RvY_07904-2 [Ramazzottius varieornatus]